MKIYFHLNLEGFSNCYIIANPERKEAVIIDPGKVTNQIIRHIEDDKYTLCAVLVTHNHGSHTRGLSTLRKIYNPEIYAADYETAGPYDQGGLRDSIAVHAWIDIISYVCSYLFTSGTEGNNFSLNINFSFKL